MTTITRRDILKLASALGLAGTIPATSDRIATAQILGQDVSERVMLDPGKFPREITMSMGSGMDQFDHDWYGVVCPEEHAEYVQARERLGKVLKDHGINSYQECGDYDAATFSFVMEMYAVGIRHGAAYENLRRSLVGETVLCTDCWGTGLGRDDDKNRKHGTVCTTCGGTGTVAMKG